MKAVFEFNNGDMTFIATCSSEEKAEALIVDAYKTYCCGDTELVRIEHDGMPMYTARHTNAVEVVEDEIEYVDEDGAPIEDSGPSDSDKDDMDGPRYDYLDYIWIIKDIEQDVAINLNGSEYYLIDNPAEDNENLVVIASL